MYKLQTQIPPVKNMSYVRISDKKDIKLASEHIREKTTIPVKSGI